jgi:hypothetical protein
MMLCRKLSKNHWNASRGMRTLAHLQMVLQLLWEQRPGEGGEEEGRQEEGAAAEVQPLNSVEGAVPVQKEGVGPWVQLREQEREQGQGQEQKQWHFAHDGEGQKLQIVA